MAEIEESAAPELLVDGEWLVQHLNDTNIRIVDTDVVDAYRRSHIPGAVLVPDNYEKDPDSNRIHILPPDKFAEMMESLGIGDDTQVVAYDNSRSLYAGRLWWALNYYGHQNTVVLDGGWKKWVGEGRPISLRRPEDPSGAKFTAKADHSLMVTTDELKEAHNKSGVVIWDVRSRGEYTGEAARSNKRPGHIPGASHLEWTEMMDEDSHTFKPAAEMRQILESKGITPEKEVLAH